MNEPEASPLLSDYEKTNALIVQMDALLAQGTAAMQRHDEFMQKHHIEPGIGKKTLLGPRVAPRDRFIFARLLDEHVGMEERLRTFEESKTAQPPRSIGVRAVGNRYRI